MQNYLKAKLSTGQDSAIAVYGDDIWENVCDEIGLNQIFTVQDLIGKLASIQHLSEVTQKQYIRATLINVNAWGAKASGPDEAPLQRVSRKYWKLV